MSIAISSPTPNQGHVTVRDFYDNTVSSQPHLSTTSDIVVLTAPLIVEFFQYGLIDWDQFYSCLHAVIVNSDWAVFEYDENKLGQRGSACPVGHGLVEPGTYILLRAGKLFDSRIFEDRIHKVPPDGHPITVEFTTLTARPRHPTVSNTSPKGTSAPTYNTLPDPIDRYSFRESTIALAHASAILVVSSVDFQSRRPISAVSPWDTFIHERMMWRCPYFLLSLESS